MLYLKLNPDEHQRGAPRRGGAVPRVSVRELLLPDPPREARGRERQVRSRRYNWTGFFLLTRRLAVCLQRLSGAGRLLLRRRRTLLRLAVPPRLRVG